MSVHGIHRRIRMPTNTDQVDRFGNSTVDEGNVSCCPKISRWCVKDIEGYILIVTTWSLLFYGYAVLMIIVFVPQNYSWPTILLNWIILHTLEFLAFTSHFRAVFTNPVGRPFPLSPL